MKRILSHHAHDHPERCYYQSCETISDFQELTELLVSLKNRKVVLLDEVTFVPEWWRAVKYAVDSGYTHILVLTGSSTHDLRKGADRMPGRFENGEELLLLPMDFVEFQKMWEQAGWPKLTRLELLSAFFRIGGFPSALAEAGPRLKNPTQAIKTYASWIIGDFEKLGKDPRYAKELMGQIAQIICTPVSFQTLAQRCQFGSHHTASEYINILEDIFAVRTLNAIDIDTGAFRFRSNKKFYFTDPLILKLAQGWAGTSSNLDEAALAEMTTNEALQRRYPKLGFLNSPSGEVDFIAPKRWAIEVKWSPVVTHLSKAYKNLKIPNKQVWFQENVFQNWPDQ